MNEEDTSKANGFLSAAQLLKVKGIGSAAWDDWHQSESALPKTGKKYFEPSKSWLQNMQIENGLKNRKRLLEIERVDRSSQLALAEWLPNIQRARVTKKSGQRWENFGYEEKLQLYLLPEEALLLLEMNCLELVWNGMPLSIQQAYEVLLNSENSKCTQDEYRVYSQLVRWGYKLQRFRDKSSTESKSFNMTKRIIMNPDGLWTPNTSPTVDTQISNINGSTVTLQSSSDQEDDVITIPKSDTATNEKSLKTQKLGIVSEETVLGNIKIIKNNTGSVKDSSTTATQVAKWPGSRIQRNVKLMPKRNDKVNNTNNSETTDRCPLNIVPEKRRNSNSTETSAAKKPRPEVIELSDDDIEEIPRPMSRMEILNTLPNLAGTDSVSVEIPRAYLPPGVKTTKEFYRYDRQRLLNLHQADSALKSDMRTSSVPPPHPMDNHQNGQESHFYSQRSQCQAITTYGSSNNGYSYRGMRCQREGSSFIEHNTIHSPYAGTVYQSNYVNFVMEVMGNMVRSFRQQQFQQTTICENVEMFPSRYSDVQNRYQHQQSYPIYVPSPREYYRRGGGGGGGASAGTGAQRSKNNRYNDSQRTIPEEPSQPSFSKRAGVSSWSELKRKWRDESTITIEDEEPTMMDTMADNSEVQVVEESISPLICSKSGISNLSEVYERLRIIKSANDRTVRTRKIDYSLSYEVYPVNQHYKKTSPGTPICRLFIINSTKDPYMDSSKLQRLQQESKNVPVVVALVSRSCISYIQLGVVFLPNLS